MIETKKIQEDRANQLQLKFNETIFKIMTVMKKHSISMNGISFSASEIHLIDTIGRYPEANVTQLAAHQGVTKGAISQKLKRLETNGFINRSHLPDNAKEINVGLTELGWKAFKLHVDYHKERDKEIFEFLDKASPDNIRFLLEGLDVMNKVMDRHLENEYIVMDLDDDPKVVSKKSLDK